MPDGKKELAASTWIMVFKNLLGGGIMIWMLYTHVTVKPVDPLWLFLFPGLLLEINLKAYLSDLFKK